PMARRWWTSTTAKTSMRPARRWLRPWPRTPRRWTASSRGSTPTSPPAGQRMRAEASLRRLAEIGIDVHRLRTYADAADETSTAQPGRAAATGSARALLVAGDRAHASAPLVADLLRSLAWLRVDAALAKPADAGVDGADVLVVFGDDSVRAIGARLPAQRQQAVTWVVAPALSVLARDVPARRALWSELRRMAVVSRTNGS